MQKSNKITPAPVPLSGTVHGRAPAGTRRGKILSLQKQSCRPTVRGDSALANSPKLSFETSLKLSFFPWLVACRSEEGLGYWLLR